MLLLGVYVKCWNSPDQMLYLRTDTIESQRILYIYYSFDLYISAWKSRRKKGYDFCFTYIFSDVLLNRASVASPLCKKHPHCPPQGRTLKPLARPMETGCPCCLDIWPLQHKPLIFCGSFLAFLQCGRVVWITSPICEAAGFQRPPFSAPLKRPSMFCLEVSHCGQHLCYILAVGESTEMLKGGSILTSHSRTCWNIPVSRISLYQSVLGTGSTEVTSKMVSIFLTTLQSLLGGRCKNNSFSVNLKLSFSVLHGNYRSYRAYREVWVILQP